MPSLFDPDILPVVFAGLMGFAILLYVILDGFDLGVGMLVPLAQPEDQDRMIASIGPFWDANETWLVLAVGLLLVAFPAAHGQILVALYIPVVLMLTGLVLRGVAFEFRGKTSGREKRLWTWAFAGGSLLTALTQGLMLGIYLSGLSWSGMTIAFAALCALCLPAGYGLLGSAWLIWKTEGSLQRRAVGWAKPAVIGTAAGIAAVSIATPLTHPDIAAKWFSWPELILLAPLPLTAMGLVIALWMGLRALPDRRDAWRSAPFLAASALVGSCFFGLAYSLYPHVVPGGLTIYDSASAPESLTVILIGVLVVMPIIAAYTVLAYRLFRGKARPLRY